MRFGIADENLKIFIALTGRRLIEMVARNSVSVVSVPKIASSHCLCSRAIRSVRHFTCWTRAGVRHGSGSLALVGRCAGRPRSVLSLRLMIGRLQENQLLHVVELLWLAEVPLLTAQRRFCGPDWIRSFRVLAVGPLDENELLYVVQLLLLSGEESLLAAQRCGVPGDQRFERQAGGELWSHRFSSIRCVELVRRRCGSFMDSLVEIRCSLRGETGLVDERFKMNEIKRNRIPKTNRISAYHEEFSRTKRRLGRSEPGRARIHKHR